MLWRIIKYESAVIPGSVAIINDCAFQGCNNLISLIIPNSITIIGSHAFQDCNSLTTVVIPSKITSSGDYTTIGDYAFSNCTELKSIVIPAEVTTTGEYAFYCCNKLQWYIVQTARMHRIMPWETISRSLLFSPLKIMRQLILQSSQYRLTAVLMN